MRIIIYDNKFKNTVIFIHGYRKTHDDWNITSNNKEIGIESHIRKIKNTILISMEEVDYQRSIQEISKEIYKSINHLDKTKIVCVCHSYGAIYSTCMSILYPSLFTSIIMLDPTLKTDEYLEYLKGRNLDDNDRYKIENFNKLPNYLNIPKNIIVKIHINLTSDNIKQDHKYMIELDKIVKQNMKSRLMIHFDVSHMIHYKIPHIIIDSIKNI